MALNEDYRDRYDYVKVEFNKNKHIVYELAIKREEKGMNEAIDDNLYDYGVDAKMDYATNKKSPKYQRDGGDWTNFTITNNDLNIPIIAS